MSKKEIIYKALMVREETHQKIVVEAKKTKQTVDEYIKSLMNK
jgi:predicted HicB family RNase H-like nuclease